MKAQLALRIDPEKMEKYINMSLLPHLDSLRQQGKLKTGKKKIRIEVYNFDYEGEMDE